jgi:hypothetical protein
MALDNNEMTEKEMRCYSVQLVFRKNLNIIHRELYGPGKENGNTLRCLPRELEADTCLQVID